MNEVKHRLDAVDQAWERLRSVDQDATPFDWTYTVERIALHLRKVVELIVFSSLVANQDKYRQVHPSYATHWRIGDILKKLDAIHPEFFPVNRTMTTTVGGGIDLVRSARPAATREELERLYSQCSKLIHSAQPLRHGRRMEVQLDRTPVEWTALIRGLLDEHTIKFVDGLDLFFVQMVAPPDGNVAVTWWRSDRP